MLNNSLMLNNLLMLKRKLNNLLMLKLKQFIGLFRPILRPFYSDAKRSLEGLIALDKASSIFIAKNI